VSLLNRLKRRIYNLIHSYKKINVKVDKSKIACLLRKKIQSINVTDKLGSSSWEKNRQVIRTSILDDNLSDFLNWSVIKQTMIYEADHIEYQEVMKSQLLVNSIIESKVGNPIPYYLNQSTSGNLVHHAYSVSILLKRVAVCHFDKVVEFGGGYGSMCRLFRNMNYTKKYVVYDLPEFLALQEFYLNSINTEYMKNTLLTADLDRVKDESKNTLLIATWSLSEVPLGLRERFLSSFKFNCCIIAFQSEFDGVDNIEYFNNFKSWYPNILFEVTKIDHLPGHFYLTGVRTN
jgi:putative sugar O-methyltransferase